MKREKESIDFSLYSIIFIKWSPQGFNLTRPEIYGR